VNALNELPIVRDPAADSTGEREHRGTGRPCNSVNHDRQSSIAVPRIDHDRSRGNSNTYLQADDELTNHCGFWILGEKHPSRRLLFWISLRAEAQHRLVEVQHGTKSIESQFKAVRNWGNQLYMCCEIYVRHKWRYRDAGGMRQQREWSATKERSAIGERRREGQQCPLWVVNSGGRGCDAS
jgi:hypothetical protein